MEGDLRKIFRIERHRYHLPPVQGYVTVQEVDLEQEMLLGMRVVPASSDTIRDTSPAVTYQLS